MTSTSPASNSTASVPPSQAAVAYERLRELLVTLQLPPGTPLGETELTERVGVGRTPLREALQRLAAERLVVIHPRRGTFAADINIADLTLLTELRAGLEGLAAELAAARATAEERDGLLALAAESVATDDHVAAMEKDTRLHEAIHAATHNPFLAETAARHHGLSLRIWWLFVDRLEGLTDHVDEHEQLVARIVEGDGDGARAAAEAHVRGFETAVRALW